MLITCSGCNTKMRAPDDAAGQQVQCPGCAALIRIPDAEPAPGETGMTAAPLPPEPTDAEAFSTTTTSHGSKTPAGYGDEPDDYRRRDDDDDDDDLDVSTRGRRSPRSSVNGMAMTSMILGVISIVTVFGSCCCGIFPVIAVGCGVVAIILGFMGKTPGSEGYAWAGIICGITTLVVVVLGAIAFGVFIGFDIMNQPRGLR